MRVAELERRVLTIEKVLETAPTPLPSALKSQSIREFLIERKPSTFGEKALVVAYYLEKFEANSPFGLDDLLGGFARAKEPLPSNPSDLMYQNVRKGFMMESRDKKGSGKAWVVTNSGEAFVETLPMGAR